MKHYTYDKQTGKFVVDPSFRQLGKKAVTVYTGSVLIVHDMVYDSNNNRYVGTNSKGATINLRPSQIIEMASIS